MYLKLSAVLISCGREGRVQGGQALPPKGPTALKIALKLETEYLKHKPMGDILDISHDQLCSENSKPRVSPVYLCIIICMYNLDLHEWKPIIFIFLCCM